ncbi:TSCPD domain-containing protein [Allisonella histaminiformans]|uniref:TSCPD domain-containing protein n=1 Tax=Allisonella histaminiformans TaxID=209880 RepID=UPI002E76E08C|nr:TSCPD domain-containing protein [Allisonella histaminiformans]
MNKHVEYKPEGVCARKIEFELEDGKLHNVHFTGGCPGNLCRGKNTSCADQLAKAIEENK